MNEDYLYQDRIDNQKAVDEALKGLVKSLNDPYTRYLPANLAKNQQHSIGNTNFAGAGMQVEDRDGQIFVITPLRGSPAERAGIKPNDLVLKVDGEELEGIAFLDAVEKFGDQLAPMWS